MTQTQGKIYGLHHPLMGELRYIGQTWKTLQRRLVNHICTAKRPETHRRHVVAWVLGLQREGLKPQIVERARASTQDELDRLEVESIAQAKTAGARLTNHADGGRGSRGRKLSKEHRARLHNPEVWAKIAASKKGQPSPMRGKRHTAEARAKMSVSTRGNQCAYREDVTTETLIGQIRKGASTTQVAEEFGLNRGTVRRRLGKAKEAGFEVPLLKRCIPLSLILGKLAQGYSREHISEELGVSGTYLRDKLCKARRAGVAVPKLKPGPKSEDQ